MDDSTDLQVVLVAILIASIVQAIVVYKSRNIPSTTSYLHDVAHCRIFLQLTKDVANARAETAATKAELQAMRAVLGHTRVELADAEREISMQVQGDDGQ